MNKIIKDLNLQLEHSNKQIMDMTTKQNEDFSAIRDKEANIQTQLAEMTEKLGEAERAKADAEDKVKKLEIIYEQTQAEHIKELEQSKEETNNLHEREINILTVLSSIYFRKKLKMQKKKQKILKVN